MRPRRRVLGVEIVRPIGGAESRWRPLWRPPGRKAPIRPVVPFELDGGSFVAWTGLANCLALGEGRLADAFWEAFASAVNGALAVALTAM